MAKTVENNVEVETVEEVKTTKKTKDISEIDALRAQLEAQNKQMTDLMNLVLQMQVAQQAGTPAAKSDEEWIKIVHLVGRAEGLSTYIKLSNLEVQLTDFMEERSLTKQQFEELLGKHRKWFNEGILSVANGYESIAKKYGLKTAKDYPMNSEFIQRLGTLSIADIENMYEKLPESGRDFILSYWARKVEAGDSKFKDIRKLESLNRMSNGAFDGLMQSVKYNK